MDVHWNNAFFNFEAGNVDGAESLGCDESNLGDYTPMAHNEVQVVATITTLKIGVSKPNVAFHFFLVP